MTAGPKQCPPRHAPHRCHFPLPQMSSSGAAGFAAPVGTRYTCRKCRELLFNADDVMLEASGSYFLAEVCSRQHEHFEFHSESASHSPLHTRNHSSTQLHDTAPSRTVARVRRVPRRVVEPKPCGERTKTHRHDSSPSTAALKPSHHPCGWRRRSRSRGSTRRRATPRPTEAAGRSRARTRDARPS